jgi:hypothetical protein
MTAPPRSSEPQEPMLFGWMSLPMLKTIGYLISTVSVVLLAIVSWPKAKDSAFLAACLIGGAATSMMGMLCRWLSYEIEKRAKRRR